MTTDDLPLGMRLKAQAGWNQVSADWQRFLELEPDGCFVGQWHGQPVATTTTCVFGSVAWGAGFLGEWMKRSTSAQTIMNKVAGTVFVGLALRLATTQRQ